MLERGDGKVLVLLPAVYSRHSIPNKCNSKSGQKHRINKRSTISEDDKVLNMIENIIMRNPFNKYTSLLLNSYIAMKDTYFRICTYNFCRCTCILCIIYLCVCWLECRGPES